MSCYHMHKVTDNMCNARWLSVVTGQHVAACIYLIGDFMGVGVQGSDSSSSNRKHSSVPMQPKKGWGMDQSLQNKQNMAWSKLNHA